jgi:WD40 repeat protein
MGLAFNPVNRFEVAIGDDNGVVTLWDSASNQVRDRKYGAAAELVNSVAFNADGTLLAAAYRVAGTVVWNKSGQLCPLQPTSSKSGAYGVAFAEGKKILAVASTDNAVHLRDLSKKGCPEIPDLIFRRSDLVYGVAVSPDGSRLAAASVDGTVAVWDIDAPGKPLFDIAHGQPMFAVAFSPDGNTLGATGAEGKGYFYDIIRPAEHKLKMTLPSQGGRLGQLAFSPDGRLGQRFHGSNHIRQPRRAYRTRCG